MKNKLLLLSAALFGAVSLGNYAHSMDLTQDQKREACVNRLKEVWQVSNILIENGLNTTKKAFDFICQKDPSIVYQGLATFLQHTNLLCNHYLFSAGEAIENYKFVISNIVQRIETDHEGFRKLNEALPLLSNIEDLFLSDDRFGSITRFENTTKNLKSIFYPIFNANAISFNIPNLSPEKYKYGYEKNSIKYAIKYNDMNSIIKISTQPSFKYDGSLLDFSALHGNIDAFKFFSVNDLIVTEKTCKNAIIGGNHGIIQLCTKQRNNCFKKNICLENSIELHRYDITNWLLENYLDYSPVNFESIIKYGNIPVFFSVIQNTSYDLNKLTVLHKCCKLNQKEMAEILLIDGLVDVNAPTNATITINTFATKTVEKKPIDVAKTDEMRDLLRQYGAN